MNEMNILFLGTSALKPGKGNDTACALINNKYMIDTGWYSAANMVNYNISPLDLDYIFLTHTHLDHYIGLAHYIFYLAMNKEEYFKRKPLKIAGPKKDIKNIVSITRKYLDNGTSKKLWKSIKIDIIPLVEGDIIENDDVTIKPFLTKHGIPSLGYIFQDNISKKKIVYTGDTGPFENVIINASNADLLIHEASTGANNSPVPQHSGGPDAGLIAKKANVKQLALVHYIDEQRQVTFEATKKIFPNTIMPTIGTTIKI